MRNAFHNKKGMSLIEVLVAITLLSIVSVAILRTNMVAFQSTTVNVLREEAIRLAEQDINAVHSLGFTKTFTDAQLTAGVGAAQTVLRNLRGTQVSYTVQRTIVDMGSDMKQVTVEVSWSYKAPKTVPPTNNYNHRLTTILGRAT